ncbi:PREDICTED: uncharacterized protein LOC108570428 [Habropoda laboriosa]|uniref:uncharacterized protein LOC108570428 n=1 Tax=Habropoda laboriosa TaxID=597456 RepID=UPI00083DDD4E|nr:PREDICTED: uncharacterized protein LOC108570428 [Habropoda laboriosa]
MAYISNDGCVMHNTPLHLKVFRFFMGIVYMIIMFFKTLVNPDQYYVCICRPPRPPTRRLGRPNTGDTVNIPFGGCRSCAG